MQARSLHGGRVYTYQLGSESSHGGGAMIHYFTQLI